MAVPFPPKNLVTSKSIDFSALVAQARGGPEEPWDVYDGFGGGRKKFMSDRQGPGIYGKPVSIAGGVTTHLTDPDLVSTNP